MDIYEELAQAMAQSLSPLAAADLLRSRIEPLVAALEAVEYEDNDYGWYCVWCGAYPGHAPDCQRQLALAPFLEKSE